MALLVVAVLFLGVSGLFFDALDYLMAEHLPDTAGTDALALWRAWFAQGGDPYMAQWDLDATCCFFCMSWPDAPHAMDCIYLRAANLLQRAVRQSPSC